MDGMYTLVRRPAKFIRTIARLAKGMAVERVLTWSFARVVVTLGSQRLQTA